MNTKNMLFLALIGLNFNTFGMEKVKDMLFGHHEQPTEILGGWTLSKVYENSHHITVAPIAFDITNKLFLEHSHDAAKIMDKETKNINYTFQHPDTVGIWDASFFPTGDRIVTVSDDKFLRVFALNNQKPIAQFFCHTGNYSPENIRHVGFHQDGSLLVKTFQDQTYVYVNTSSQRKANNYLNELMIKYLADNKTDASKIDSRDTLVKTLALHFALNAEQLAIVWNTISADTQTLLLNAVQNKK